MPEIPPRGAFISRQHELSLLCRALEDAQRGHGQIVLVSGEAGYPRPRRSRRRDGDVLRNGTRRLVRRIGYMHTLDDWPRIKQVLEEALARDGTDRQAYLTRACGTDAALRARVEALLAAEESAATFLEKPAGRLLEGGRHWQDLSGRIVSSYRLESRLGAGGMGEVYLAHDAKLDRPVALKFLSPELATDRDRLRRFHQEARAASSLNHPHIVVVHDFGELDSRPYIVTEFIEGETLRQRMQGRPLPVRDVVDIGIQIAGALAAAHARGLVHRDIKPENVMVRPDGYVKVLDFGLAKLATTKQSPEEVAPDTITQPGIVMGTPRYMSPEQARGLDLDARSDVWSLGVVLYEMATGALPFATAIDDVNRELPADFGKIIRRALETDREHRYRSAAELCADLKRTRRDIEDLGDVMPAEVASLREQKIQFTTTADGAGIAYSTTGQGPIIVRVLGHFTHLEKEWEWPELRRFWECLAERYTVVRYDGRGIGLSDRFTGDFTEETRQLDLDAVLNAVGAQKATLLGISEGGWTAAMYATAHPDRVAHLILYGAYCRGAQARPGYDREEDQALVTLIRKGWGRDTPTFRQVFTSQFFRSDADPRLLAHFNELQRLSADGETAARYHEACHGRGDGRDLFRQVTTPTLVLHCQDDLAVSAEEGRLLASLIRGAQLVLLPSGTHYFPTDADVALKAAGAIARFLQTASSRN
jgi:pimeloyl-ACP methyl ester carboxylesterase